MALNAAKQNVDDEFYTRKQDIAKELCNYKKQLKDKVVFCNCDDPEWSNFWIYLHENFSEFGLKGLIATHYEPSGKSSYKMEYYGGNDNDPKDWHQKTLQGNGDFRSQECIEILKSVDVVITNPPFSLFRDYIAQLMEYKKQFIILANPNSIVYKEIFPLFVDNKMWLGYKTMGSETYFIVTESHAQKLKETKREGSGYVIIDGKIYGRAQAVWYTNIEIPKRAKNYLDELDKSYERHPELYLHYYNYNAINVDKVEDIPEDYFGVMGVPITFLAQHNPSEFKLLSHHEPAIELEHYKTSPKFKEKKSRQIKINGVLCQKTYHRLFIQRVERSNYDYK